MVKIKVLRWKQYSFTSLTKTKVIFHFSEFQVLHHLCSVFFNIIIITPVDIFY